ncbi:MAG: glycosyltransferase [Anaerolineales bacterium]|nr:glycosyltransferase [Anaerolineales bacterium]
MNILFLTQLLPYPLVGGQKIRAYYMLRQLALNHDVTLVSFTREDDRFEDIEHLREFCTAVHSIPMQRSMFKNVQAAVESLLTRQSMVITRDRLPAMQEFLRRLVNSVNFDVIHADQTAMAQYALYAQANAANEPRTILDQHNALYLVVERQANYERGRLQRLLWQWEAKRLAAYEADICRRFDHVITVTQEDKDALLRLYPSDEAEYLAAHFSPLPICVDPFKQQLLPRADADPQIIFLGTMFWPPNVEGVLWFAQEILPLILKRMPQARFKIVGKNPPTAVSDLQTFGSHVDVTGFVADIKPLLASSRVFVVPLLAGGGMRVKILDAWQWGLPVVSTTIGAEGIQLVNGENILLADAPQAFADAVVAVLADFELARRLRENGRFWVQNQYNWRNIYPQLDAVYSAAACKKQMSDPKFTMS